MAQPRVFVSSTCYDLSQIREDLRAFISTLGYEARLSEYNDVAYNSTSSLETDCHAEIKLCDIVVGIIGGKFGSNSASENRSVSMSEMDTAIENNKQIYVFILKDVYTEYNTYIVNKNNTEVKYVSVDDVRIFEYIESLRSNSNIIINSFTTAKDITQALKQQWAGLFQNYLNNRERLYDENEVHKIYQITEKLEEVKMLFETTLTEYQELIPVATFSKVYVNPVFIEFRNTLFDQNHPIVLFRNNDELDTFLNTLDYEAAIELLDDEKTYIKSTIDGFQYKIYIRNKILFNSSGKTNYIDDKQIKKLALQKTPLFRFEQLNTSDNNSTVNDDDLPF